MSKFIPGPADASLLMQDVVTQTASSNSAWFDLGQGFSPGGLGVPVGAVLNVTAIKTTAGNETYSFTLQECDADATGAADASTARLIGAAASVSATGLALVKGLSTGRFVRLLAAIGGTTPSITYTANLNP